MPKSVRKKIKYPKERAILSDVLPYETPVIFSNRYFYEFLVKHEISIDGIRLKFKRPNDYDDNTFNAFKEYLKIIFDLSRPIYPDYTEIPDNEYRKMPFKYKILHKKDDFRELAIMHPINQLDVVGFYDQFSQLIIYYCKKSSFSIRKPDSVAKFTYFDDRLHETMVGDPTDPLELVGKEYKHLKTYFSYQRYAHIHKFYEDYRYQRSETKFDKLFRFDISKCFDSIYTHSITWAILGKDSVKDNIIKSKATFGGIFDRLLQNINYGETNGIIIGPEVSRIFAELILQHIDHHVENIMKERGHIHKVDYELFRYVDDYFIFFDNDSVKDVIVKEFKHCFKEFKMFVNDAKSISYDKPLITELSSAKTKIANLFESEPVFRISKTDLTESVDKETLELRLYKYSFWLNPNKLAEKFKIIIKDSKVEYRDVLNYSMLLLGIKIERNILQFEDRMIEISQYGHKKELTDEELVIKDKLENKFTRYILNYLDFVFFLYSVSPRVNTTIKLCHILGKIIKYFDGVYKYETREYRFSFHYREQILKKISDEVHFALNKSKFDRSMQIESMYLLILIRELGKRYRLSLGALLKYLGLKDGTEEGVSEIKSGHFNYFSIVVVLYYIRNIKIYQDLRANLQSYIKLFLNEIPHERRKRCSESVFLILDLLTCPFLDQTFKKELISIFDSSLDEAQKDHMIRFAKEQKYWFIKWTNFDLTKELFFKSSISAYS